MNRVGKKGFLVAISVFLRRDPSSRRYLYDSSKKLGGGGRSEGKVRWAGRRSEKRRRLSGDVEVSNILWSDPFILLLTNQSL